MSTARRLPITIHAPLGLGLVTAPTLRDGLEFWARFHAAAAGLVRVRIEVGAQETTCFVNATIPCARVDEMVASLMFVIIDHYVHFFTERYGNASHVSLRPECGTSPRVFAEVMECRVRPGRAAYAFTIDSRLLALRSPLADRVTFRSECDRCARLFDLDGEDFNLVDAVQERISFSVADPPTLPLLASHFGCTVRQLRYLLTKHGTTYQEQIAVCKEEVAKNLVCNTRLSLSEIGYQIGYNDASNFSIAFKKWTGEAPSRFRARVAAERERGA